MNVFIKKKKKKNKNIVYIFVENQTRCRSLWQYITNVWKIILKAVILTIIPNNRQLRVTD